MELESEETWLRKRIIRLGPSCATQTTHALKRVCGSSLGMQRTGWNCCRSPVDDKCSSNSRCSQTDSSLGEIGQPVPGVER